MKEEKILGKFLEEFWFAPQDALLRAAECFLWLKTEFNPPTLDIGCGDGRISKLLFPTHKEIDVGLDPDKGAVSGAKISAVYRRVVLGDATKMPFRNSIFGTVISNSTFEHIRDDKKAFKEVGRVLKKGGKFILTVPTPFFNNYLNEAGVDKKNLKKCNDRLEQFHFYGIEEWRKILAENHMKIKNFKYYFSRKEVLVWYRLYQVATFKPYKRELWSYLKDSPYGKFAPKRLIIKFLKLYLERHFKRGLMAGKMGAWVFIEAQKV